MTIKRVQDAAARRGIWFDGIKKYRNNMVGTAYEIFTPNGRGFFQADTVNWIYKEIMKYKPLND